MIALIIITAVAVGAIFGVRQYFLETIWDAEFQHKLERNQLLREAELFMDATRELNGIVGQLERDARMASDLEVSLQLWVTQLEGHVSDYEGREIADALGKDLKQLLDENYELLTVLVESIATDA